MRIRIHPEAEAEFLDSVDYYATDSARNSERFIREVETAFDDISLFPNRFPAFEYGTQIRILKRFPFSVVYRLSQNEVHVVSIMHQSREPGYWRQRRIE